MHNKNVRKAYAAIVVGLFGVFFAFLRINHISAIGALICGATALCFTFAGENGAESDKEQKGMVYTIGLYSSILSLETGVGSIVVALIPIL